jgi:hypothetical protein
MKNESYYLMANIPQHTLYNTVALLFYLEQGVYLELPGNGLPRKGFNAGLWIRITFMRIRIQIFLLMWIRIRILLLIKEMGVCDFWSIDPPRLHLKPSGLPSECPRPSTALF